MQLLSVMGLVIQKRCGQENKRQREQRPQEPYRSDRRIRGTGLSKVEIISCEQSFRSKS